MTYATLKESARAEIEVRRSRFIATASPVKDFDDAKQKLAAVKKEFGDATHVCYACVADVSGLERRFSDAGEPQGSAGAPLSAALESRGLKKSLVAVARYFGGIKLGTGGLAAAYCGAASIALERAGVVNESLCRILEITVDLRDAGALVKLLSDAVFIKKEYADVARFVIAVEDEASARTRIADATAGRAAVTSRGEGFFALPEYNVNH